MKLIYPEWSSGIMIDDEKINIICIEDQAEYSRIIFELYGQYMGKEGRFVLSDGDKVLSINKDTVVIDSPFTSIPDKTRAQKAIIKALSQVALDEEMLQTVELKSAIIRYLYTLSDYIDYEISFDEAIDIVSLLKVFSPSPIIDEDGLTEGIVDKIMYTQKLLDTKLFFCLNFKSFFTKQELEALYRTMISNKIHLILLENRNNCEIIEYERMLTIDADLCEI